MVLKSQETQWMMEGKMYSHISAQIGAIMVSVCSRPGVLKVLREDEQSGLSNTTSNDKLWGRKNQGESAIKLYFRHRALGSKKFLK